MADGCVWVDGRFSAPAEATVSALDPGLLLGDGVFESLRVDGGRPYLLDRHLDRLARAARTLGFPPLPDLEPRVIETVQRAGLADAYVRITVTRRPTVVIAALPPPRVGGFDSGDNRPLSAITIPVLGRPLTQPVKTTSRQDSVLARRRIAAAGAGEGLYVTPDDEVLEATGANVFAIEGHALVTPPADRCLAGITRGRLLELAPDAGLAPREEPLSLARLRAADGVLLTNAVRGVRALAAIDGRPLARARVALAILYARDRAR